MKKYFFEDELGYVWSTTWDEIVRDAKDYEEEYEEKLTNYLDFFMDNINDSTVEWTLEKSPNLRSGPQYYNPKLIKVNEEY